MPENKVNTQNNVSNTSDVQPEDMHPVNTNAQMSPGIWPVIHNIIEVLSFFVVACTLFITSLTIKEMKKDRNETYKAVITANPITEYFATNESAFGPSNIPSEGIENHKIYVTGSTSEYDDPSIHYALFYTPLSDFSLRTGYSEIMFTNIGSGMATKVKFSCDIENIYELFSMLMEVDSSASHYASLEDMTFSYHPTDYYSKTYPDVKPWRLQEDIDAVLEVSPYNYEYSYMLSNGEEVYSIKLPMVYSLLFAEILLHDSQAEPSIKLKVEFTDTQGLEYYELVTLKASYPSYLAYIKFTDEGRQPGIHSAIRYIITADHSNPVPK